MYLKICRQQQKVHRTDSTLAGLLCHLLAAHSFSSRFLGGGHPLAEDQGQGLSKRSTKCAVSTSIPVSSSENRRLLDASEIATSWPTLWYLSSAAALSLFWYLHASSADYFWTQDLNCFQFSRQYAWLTLRRKPEAEQTSFHPSRGRNITQFVSQMLAARWIMNMFSINVDILMHFISFYPFPSFSNLFHQCAWAKSVRHFFVLRVL